MKKKILVIAIVLLAALSLPSLFINQSPGEEKASETSEQKEQITEEQESPEEQIKKLVQKELEGKNNMGFPYEDKIEIKQAPNGKYNVDIRFNADDNLTKSLIKSEIQMKISEILTTLFTEREDIQKVTVSALFPLQDKYGESFRGDVYIAELGIEEARKVNWNIDPATLARDVVPKVYKTSYPYPIFEKK